MNRPLLRLAVSCVRAWTRLYTWRLPPAFREARRAEIESDLWEFQRDAAGDHILGSALHILLRLLIGIPDDLGWHVEQTAVAGTLAQRSIALSARVAGAAFFMSALWVMDADAGRRRQAPALIGTAAVFDQEIEGIMTTRSGDVSHPERKRRLLTAGIVATAGASMLPQLAAQSPPAARGPAFEVASIRPNPTGSTGPTRTEVQPGGRFVAINIPIRLLIGQAYRVSSLRLVGGPGWIASEHFDINAKADGELFPTGGVRPLESAIRELLADRFKLVVHTESRQLPIYALVVARSDGGLGPNLTRSSRTDCDAVLAAAPGRGGVPPPPPAPGEAPPCGARTFPGTLWADSLPLSFLAGAVSGEVNRTVVDRTGLAGRFNFRLTWTPDQMPRRPPGDPDDLPPIDPNGPSIFTAVQEQLGLKLESTTGPVDVLVIDSVERPTPD